VVVAINSGSSSDDQSFNLEGATAASMTPWQTTSTGGLVQQSAVTVSGGTFTYSLPPLSITTFVQQPIP
jgi:glucuronoarabinoxylan endo-1,4-beta-xylanase